MLRYAFFEPEPRRQPAVVADYRVIYLDRLQLVERALQGHAYLVGDRFGVADISVGYAFMLARMLKLDEVTPDRKSCVKGQSVSVSVYLGGRRLIKQKKHLQTSQHSR